MAPQWTQTRAAHSGPSVSAYNPIPANAERSRDNAGQSEKMGVKGLIGTQQKSSNGEIMHMQRHWSADWGWKWGDMKKKSCGLTGWVRKRLFGKKDREGFFYVPKKLQGRVRRVSMRMAPMLLYLLLDYIVILEKWEPDVKWCGVQQSAWRNQAHSQKKVGCGILMEHVAKLNEVSVRPSTLNREATVLQRGWRCSEFVTQLEKEMQRADEQVMKVSGSKKMDGDNQGGAEKLIGTLCATSPLHTEDHRIKSEKATKLTKERRAVREKFRELQFGGGCGVMEEAEGGTDLYTRELELEKVSKWHSILTTSRLSARSWTFAARKWLVAEDSGDTQTPPQHMQKKDMEEGVALKRLVHQLKKYRGVCQRPMAMRHAEEVEGWAEEFTRSPTYEVGTVWITVEMIGNVLVAHKEEAEKQLDKQQAEAEASGDRRSELLAAVHRDAQREDEGREREAGDVPDQARWGRRGGGGTRASGRPRAPHEVVSGGSRGRWANE
ncbi:unnamed protein product [Prorocentrum cordatum]|uniref:Uncharacterized protein n=1 Tax=Prorocentrum cordatum TaxID=2364126 RepID=A0ABN9VSV7_9DINO|nr:unnamed protein product [Polarella glacialis]